MGPCIRLLLFTLLCFSFNPSFADEANNAVDQAEDAPDTPNAPVLDDRPPTLINMTALPSSIVNGSVNVITGDYLIADVDYTVAGPDPYVLGHSYSSSSLEPGSMGRGWNFHHHHLLEVFQPTGATYRDKEKECSGNDIYVYLIEPFGGRIAFKGSCVEASGPPKLLDFEVITKYTGFTNVIGNKISGQTNVKNFEIDFDRKDNAFTVTLGDGTKRTYERAWKASEQKKLTPHRVKNYRDYQLTYEYLPSGNYYKYHYNEKQKISKITLHNKDHKEISDIHFKKENNQLHVKTSDKQEITYSLEKLVKGSNRGKHSISAITKPGVPTTHFEYSDKGQNYDKRVKKLKRDDGYYVKTKYYRNGPTKVGSKEVEPDGKKERHFIRNRVSRQMAPLGPDGTEITTHRYFYYQKTDKSPAHCTVRDAYNNITRYYWNGSRRLTKIVKIPQGKKKPIMTETFTWGTGKHQGYLLARNIFDENHKPKLSRVFDYDSRGNIKSETLYGRFTQNAGKLVLKDGLPDKASTCDKLETTYKYSDNGLNLKLSECDPLGNYTYFDYYKGTNLLKSKFTCDGEKIKKREFYKYDENAILIEEIVDDGTRHDKHDLQHVTERHIKRITPRKESPRFGEPEVIEEHALEGKKERLLKKTIHSFDSLGFVKRTKIYDCNEALVSTTEYQHDEVGRLLYTKDALGREEFTTYDKHGRLETKRGPRDDVIVRYEYDIAGRVKREIEEHKNGPILATSYEYDLLGRKVKVINPQGQATSYEYDMLSRITKITYPTIFDHQGNPHTPTKSYKYKELGTLVIENDENNRTTKSIYSASGKLFARYHSDGTRWFYRYNKLGKVFREVTPTRARNYCHYDAFGRVTEEVMRHNNRCLSRKKYSYNTFHLVKTEGPTNEITHYTYDFAGRKIEELFGNKKTTYHYDSLSRLCEERDYYNDNDYTASCFSYDALHRKVSETLKDSQGTTLTHKTFGYDIEGNVSEVAESIMCKIATTKTSYYPHGLVKEVIDAEGHSTKCFYDYFFSNIHGQTVVKKSTVDARGCTHDEVFDTRGNLHCTMDYDPFGNLIAKQELYYDPASNLIRTHDHSIIEGKVEKIVTNTLTYGHQNRLEQIIEAFDTPEQKTTRYTYNEFGQKHQTIHADGTIITNTYDDKGRVKEFYAEDRSLHYDYAYDASDRILSVTNRLSGEKTERTYDATGDLLSERLETGLKLDYSYDRAGRLSTLTLPDNSHIQYSYSPMFLQKITRANAANEPLWHYEVTKRDLSGHILAASLPKKGGTLSYSYDMLGRRVQTSHPAFKEEAVKFDAVGNLLEFKRDGRINTYKYDYLSQLTEEKGHSFHTYTYDSLYNRRSLDTSAYTVNSLHSVLSDGKRSFSYDKRANRTESDGAKYRYDALDRLIEVEKDNKRYIYSYDAFDRRIQKEVFAKAGNEWKSEHVEKYIYQLQNEIGSCDIYGTIKELRILGEGLGAEIGATVAMELQDTLYVALNDRRGNVAALLDHDTAQVVESYEYDAFGNETTTSGGQATNNPWRFASKRVDPETGLVYFGRRYYDPSLGKWLTQDPLGLKEGPNLYAYVMNNPITMFDMYGLEALGSDQGSQSGTCYNAQYGLGREAQDRVDDERRDMRHEIAYRQQEIAEFKNGIQQTQFAWNLPNDSDAEKQRSSSFWSKVQDFMWKAVDYGLIGVDAYCLAADAYFVCSITSAGLFHIFSAHVAASGFGAKATSQAGRCFTKWARGQIGHRLSSAIENSTKTAFRALNKYEMKNLPKNPNDLLKRGYQEISHSRAAQRGHRTFKNPVTGQEFRHDKGKPGMPGHEGRDHYHAYNSESSSRHSEYLDRNGNPCREYSPESHIYPE